MKLKKEIIVACCVIIACLGIVLTGCGNGSGDTDAESNTEKYVEDSGDADVENNTEKYVEDSGDADAENNTEKYVEDSGDTDAENNTEKYVEDSGDTDAESPYVGTWVSKVAECGGIESDVEEIMGAFEITFNADGTYSWLQQGDTSNGKWELSEEGVKIIEKSGVKFSLTNKDEKLIMDIPIGDISVIYYFEKKQ